MYLSLSAGGSPESLKTMLRSQADTQLQSQNADSPCRQVADDVLAYIDTQAAGKATVSVSVTLSISVTGS